RDVTKVASEPRLRPVEPGLRPVEPRYSVLLVRTSHDLSPIRFSYFDSYDTIDIPFYLLSMIERNVTKVASEPKLRHVEPGLRPAEPSIELSSLFHSLITKMVGTCGSTPELSGTAFDAAVQRASYPHFFL
nr:hypothetical protein [Tanacetum cinerariifolium]